MPIKRNVLSLPIGEYTGPAEYAKVSWGPTETVTFGEVAGFDWDYDVTPKTVTFRPADHTERNLVQGCGIYWQVRAKAVVDGGAQTYLLIRPRHHSNDNKAISIPVDRVEYIR